MVNSKRFLTPKKRGGAKGSHKRMRGGEFQRGQQVLHLDVGDVGTYIGTSKVGDNYVDVRFPNKEGPITVPKDSITPLISPEEASVMLDAMDKEPWGNGSGTINRREFSVPDIKKVNFFKAFGINDGGSQNFDGLIEELRGVDSDIVKDGEDGKQIVLSKLREVYLPQAKVMIPPVEGVRVTMTGMTPADEQATADAQAAAAAAKQKKEGDKLYAKNHEIHAAFEALDTKRDRVLETQELKDSDGDKLIDLIKAVFNDNSIKTPADFRDKENTVESFVYVFDNDGDGKLREEELIDNQEALIDQANVEVKLSTQPKNRQQFPDGETPFANILSDDNDQAQENKIEKTVLGDYFDGANLNQVREWEAGKMIPEECYTKINAKYFNIQEGKLLKDMLTLSVVEKRRSELVENIKSIVKELAESFGLNDASIKNIEENLQLTEALVDDSDSKSTLILDWAKIDLVPKDLMVKLSTALSSNGNRYKITEPDPKGSPYYHLQISNSQGGAVSNVVPLKKVIPNETPAFKVYLDEVLMKGDQGESTVIKELKTLLGQKPAEKIFQVFRYLNFKAFIGTSLDLLITTEETRFNLAKKVLSTLQGNATKLRTKKKGVFSFSMSKSATAVESDLGEIVKQLLERQSINQKKKIMVTENQFSSIFERALGVNSEPYGVEAKLSSYHSLTKTIVQKAIDAMSGKSSMKIGDLKSSINMGTPEPPFREYLSEINVKDLFVEQILHDADINGDGDLTEDELKAYQAHLSKDLIHKLHELIRFVGLLVCTISRIGGTNTGKSSMFRTRFYQKSVDTGFQLGSFEKRFGQALVVLYNLINDLYVPSVFTQNFTYTDILPNILKDVTNLDSNMDKLKENIQGIYGQIFKAFKMIQGNETEDWNNDPTSNNQLFGVLSLLILKRLNKDGKLNSINKEELTGPNNCYKRLFDQLKGDFLETSPKLIEEINRLSVLTGTTQTSGGGGLQELEKLRQTLYTKKIYPPLKTPFMRSLMGPNKIDLLFLLAPVANREEEVTLTPQSKNMYKGTTLIGTNYSNSVYCYRKPYKGLTGTKYHTTGGKNSKKRRSQVVNSKKRQSTSQQKQTPKRKTAQQQSKTKSKSPQQQQKKQQKKQQQKQSQQKKNTQAQKKSSKNGKK